MIEPTQQPEEDLAEQFNRYLEMLGFKSEENKKFHAEALKMIGEGEPKTVVMAYLYQRVYLAQAFKEEDDKLEAARAVEIGVLKPQAHATYREEQKRPSHMSVPMQ